MKITAFSIIAACAAFAIVWLGQRGGASHPKARDANEGKPAGLSAEGPVREAERASSPAVAGRSQRSQSTSPATDGEGGRVNGTTRSGDGPSSAVNRGGMHEDQRRGASELRNDGPLVSDNGDAGKSVEGRQVIVAPPVGIRLGSDVRLPAAAMPIDFDMSPVAEKVLRTIVDDYYRDLATGMAGDIESVRNGEGDQGVVVEQTEDGEKTVVVGNGGIAEEARKRADQRFKALFGNAAYNRLTMHSALERMLPAD